MSAGLTCQPRENKRVWFPQLLAVSSSFPVHALPAWMQRTVSSQIQRDSWHRERGQWEAVPSQSRTLGIRGDVGPLLMVPLVGSGIPCLGSCQGERVSDHGLLDGCWGRRPQEGPWVPVAAPTSEAPGLSPGGRGPLRAVSHCEHARPAFVPGGVLPPSPYGESTQAGLGPSLMTCSA